MVRASDYLDVAGGVAGWLLTATAHGWSSVVEFPLALAMFPDNVDTDDDDAVIALDEALDPLISLLHDGTRLVEAQSGRFFAVAELAGSAVLDDTGVYGLLEVEALSFGYADDARIGAAKSLIRCVASHSADLLCLAMLLHQRSTGRAAEPSPEAWAAVRAVASEAAGPMVVRAAASVVDAIATPETRQGVASMLNRLPS